MAAIATSTTTAVPGERLLQDPAAVAAAVAAGRATGGSTRLRHRRNVRAAQKKRILHENIILLSYTVIFCVKKTLKLVLGRP